MIDIKRLSSSGPGQAKKVAQAIEETGLTATNQRIGILHYIWYESHHPCADQIREWAVEHFPKISTGTIYNSINAFLEHDLIRSVSLPGTRVVRYEGNFSSHYHLIDKNTGELIDLPKDKVKIHHDIEGYDIDQVEIFIYATKRP